jgi:hypothetical protein
MSNYSNYTDTDPAKLVEREFAEAWRPDPGDKLSGEVVELSARAGYDGELYPIVTIRQRDGIELAVHAFHAVLRNELAKLAPQPGQRIAIRYDGQKGGDDGRSRYHSYRVATDRVPAFRWGAFSEDAGAGAQSAEADVIPDTTGLSEQLTQDADDDIPF